MSDLIRSEERKSPDEAAYSKPVMREELTTGQQMMIDPSSYLLIPGHEVQQLS